MVLEFLVWICMHAGHDGNVGRRSMERNMLIDEYVGSLDGSKNNIIIPSIVPDTFVGLEK